VSPRKLDFIYGLIFASYLGSRLVAVRLKGGKICFVHSSLLCRESKRFAALLTGSFYESENLEIHLPEEEPDVFACFVQYLYCTSLEGPGSRMLTSSSLKAAAPTWVLGQLYVMAERLVADRFKATITGYIKLRAAQPQGLTNDDLCGLLKIAHEEIAQRTPENEDFLRNLVFSQVAVRLRAPSGTGTLHSSTEFRNILLAHPEMSQELLLRMLDSPNQVDTPTETATPVKNLQLPRPPVSSHARTPRKR
jgi:hypothetical protein